MMGCPRSSRVLLSNKKFILNSLYKENELSEISESILLPGNDAREYEIGFIIVN